MRIHNGSKVVLALITIVMLLGITVSPAFAFAGGPLVGWGRDDRGQATVLAGTDFMAIAGGWEHSLALRPDGSLMGWGADGFGQATVPAGTFIAIAAGSAHNVDIIPEPATMILLGIGLLGLAGYAKKKVIAWTGPQKHED